MTRSTYDKKGDDTNHPWLRTAALLSALALFAACSPSAGQKPGVATTTRTKEQTNMQSELTQIQHAETIWADSLKLGNVKLLATIIGPDFTFIGPDGTVENRSAYLAGYEQLPQLGVKVESIDMHEVDTRLFGDVAIVTGRVIAKVQMKDQPITENVRFTRVYQRKGNTWLMVSGQGTRLIGPPGT